LKVVIVEDERPAADRLRMLLERYHPDTEILAVLDSVEGSVRWFTENEVRADLIFMDIRLTDGLSFDIFKKVKINQPLIFTTAYNEYAIEAFKLNSIDYLLKPVSEEDLNRSMKKLASLRENLMDGHQRIELEELAKVLGKLQKTYKNRFMVKVGEHIRSIPVDKIVMFYADGRVVYVVTDQGREYIVDFKMEELDEVLDPEIFFRINRSYTLNINAIRDVIVYSNSRLKILMEREFENDLIVSREKVNTFKMWFGMR
jgi:DNA-binding LytR/AlgR family response regulator